MSDSRSFPPRGNWAISQRGSQSAGLYALALIDLTSFSGSTDRTARSITDSAGSLGDVAFTAFAFNVNPKSMSLEEPAAVQITPTQGGQFVEHQGQIYKNINISGTTGLRPNYSQRGGFIPLVGINSPIATTAVDRETGLPQGERTGFDDFLALRNLFRLYWDCKNDDRRAPSTIMVWQNGKEGEYYVVEPLMFRSDREASAPLTTSYVIQLRTIERLDVRALRSFSDSYINRNGVDSFFARLSNIKRQLTSGFVIAQAFVDRTATIGQATVNEVLTPVNDVLKALTGVITSGRRIFDIPQNSLSGVAMSATELATALDALPNNSYVSSGVMSQTAIAANAYKNIARQLNALTNEYLLFSTPLSTTVSQKRQAYRNPTIGLPLSGGSPTNLVNQSVPNSAGVAVIQSGEDIRAVAQRLLGDGAKWKVLVLLNQLKPPYISKNGDGNNVLRPNDEILYPRAASTQQTAITPTPQKFVNASTLSQRLGRDIKLRSINGSSGSPTYDIEVSPTGDIATIEGIENMSQALIIKFATEQGELPTHPDFGLQFALGSKAKLPTLINYQLNVRATILSDRRIDSVGSLGVSVTGNVLSVKGTVTVKGFDDTLPLELNVQR